MIFVNPYSHASSGTVFDAGLAWEFNGTDEYMNAAGGASLISGSDWTLSAWAWRDSGGTDSVCSTSSYVLQMNFGQYRYAWGGTDLTATGFPVTTWTHIMIVYVDSTRTASLYTDGTFRVSQTAGVSQPSGMNNIGRATAGTANYWSGKIREVSVFDVAADATLRSFLYNSGTPQDLTGQSNLCHYYGAWNSADGTGGIIDMGSKGTDLTFMNMTAAANIVSA